MYRKLRNQISPASLLAMTALFVALGGVSYAAATIGTSDLKNGAVTTKKLKKNAVTTAKIKADAVTGAKVKESTLSEVPKAAEANHAANANTASNAEKLGNVAATQFGSGIVGAAVTAPPAAALAPSIVTGAPIGSGEFQIPVPVPMTIKNLTVRAVGDLSRTFVVSVRAPGGDALACGGVVICTAPGSASFVPGQMIELSATVLPGPGVFGGALYQVGYQIVP